MNVFVEPTGRRIQPFDDPIGETPICNRPLSQWQARAFREAGLRRIPRREPPCLVVPDTLLASGSALRELADRAAGKNAVLVLGRSLFGRSTTPVQPGVTETPEGWRFEAVRYDSGGDEPAADVVVDPQERRFELDLPKQFTGTDTVEISVPRRLVMTLHHWVHILWANQMAGGSEVMNTPKWQLGLRVLSAVARSRSLNKWDILGKLNVIGRGCDIHPTALVEGCTLGDNVKVGPYARLLFSNLDRGAQAMAGAYVEMCVLGERALVTEQSVLRLSVLYPEAVASQSIMQQCVLGREATTTYGSLSLDLNFENDIQVKLDGVLHTTATRFMGSAFGHRCRIGTGLWLAAGRMVPNDYFLIRDPDRTLSDLPDGLADAGPLAGSQPRLKPLR